jgi:hypothetical protein
MIRGRSLKGASFTSGADRNLTTSYSALFPNNASHVG